MIACFDVQYEETRAYVAGLLFQDWADEEASKVYTEVMDIPGDYESGKFYKRELPCLLHLLNQIEEPLSHILIDGYCYVSESGEKGLGGFLYESLEQQIPVIGIAKNPFKRRNHSREWLRAGSKKPLFVSSIGIDIKEAIEFLYMLHGPYRIPTLLKSVDQAARELARPE